MKFKTAGYIAMGVVLVGVGSVAWSISQSVGSRSVTPTVPTQVAQPIVVQVPQPAPVSYTQPVQPVVVYSPPPVPQPVYVPAPTPAPQPVKRLATTGEIRAAVVDWLARNGDRRGQSKLVDVLPRASFRVTAIRFGDNSPMAHLSNDPRQWSQLKIDVDRNNVDDEKWLLQNGGLYKREVTDASGKTIGAPEYFNK